MKYKFHAEFDRTLNAFSVEREEGPTINPPYVDSRVLCEPSKEKDIQNVDNALSVHWNIFSEASSI